jgi:hypothetical protein
MFEEGKADTARHLELDSAEEIRCKVLFQLARYWFFNESRMIPGYASLTHGGKDL